MKSPFGILEDYIAGKPVAGKIQRMVSLSISAYLASCLYVGGFGDYQWIDFLDYRAMIAFFMRGGFIVPTVCFLIVHFSIDMAFNLFFRTTTYRKADKWLKATDVINATDWCDEDELTPDSSGVYVPSVWLKLYLIIKLNIVLKIARPVLKDIRRWQSILPQRFQLFGKILIAAVIYAIQYHSVFTWFVWGVVTALLITLSIIWYGYILLDITPIVLRRFDNRLTDWMEQKKLENPTVPS